MSPCLTTSWDDGHPLDLRVAEMLREHRLRGTFYVPRSTSGGTVTASDLRDLATEFEVGAHTLDHVYLTQVPDEEADRQITECKSWIEQRTGRPCTMFCPPGGRYRRRHLRTIRNVGFQAVRSVELLSLRYPRHVDGLLVMPTTLQAHPHRRSTYLRNAAKRGAWHNLWHYVACGFPQDWEQLAAFLLRRAVETGGVFHLWGHSWELDRADQWSRLRRVFKLMEQFAEHAPCLTNAEVCDRMALRAAEPAAAHV